MIDLTVERLIQLLKGADLDTDVCQVLEEWRSEYTTSVSEAQQQAEQHAKSNPPKYGVRRVVPRGVGVQGHPALDTIETASLTYEEMPMFAKHVGVPLDDLQAVLDGKRRSIVGKGGEWMSWVTQWSSSRPYQDMTAKLEFQAMLEREDKELLVKVGAMNEQKKQASDALQAVPGHNAWRN